MVYCQEMNELLQQLRFLLINCNIVFTANPVGPLHVDFYAAEDTPNISIGGFNIYYEQTQCILN